MPSVFRYFRSRAELFSCEGKVNEYMVITSKGRSETVSSMNNDRMALMDDSTTYINGDLVTNISKNTRYFITAMQSSTEATQAQLRKINCTIDIYKISGSTSSGFTKTSLFTDQEAIQRTISDNMKLYDSGLLSTTVKKFILPMINIALTNRIIFNGINYSINAIDDSKYENLLEVQVEPDKRNAK